MQEISGEETWSPAQAAANTGKEDVVKKGCLYLHPLVFQHWRIELNKVSWAIEAE